MSAYGENYKTNKDDKENNLGEGTMHTPTPNQIK